MAQHLHESKLLSEESGKWKENRESETRRQI